LFLESCRAEELVEQHEVAGVEHLLRRSLVSNAQSQLFSCRIVESFSSLRC
jgi:hypothetical protein